MRDISALLEEHGEARSRRRSRRGATTVRSTGHDRCRHLRMGDQLCVRTAARPQRTSRLEQARLELGESWIDLPEASLPYYARAPPPRRRRGPRLRSCAIPGSTPGGQDRSHRTRGLQRRTHVATLTRRECASLPDGRRPRDTRSRSEEVPARRWNSTRLPGRASNQRRARRTSTRRCNRSTTRAKAS